MNESGAHRLRILHKTRQGLFRSDDLARLFDIEGDNTLHKTLERWVSRGLLRRLRKGVFMLPDASPSEWEIANALVTPSYISLASALNFHGLLTQAPRPVFSVTPGRPRRFDVDGREYIYAHVDASLYFGFERKDRFLIALPEKALLDALYLRGKGRYTLDFSELDLQKVRWPILRRWVRQTGKNTLVRAVKALQGARR